MTPDEFHPWADLLPEPTLLARSDGHVLAASRAVRKRLGIDPTDLVGRSLTTLTTDPPDRVAEFLRTCSRVREFHPGALTLSAGGRDVPCRCEGAALRPADGSGPAELLLRLMPKESAVIPLTALTERIREQVRAATRRRQVEAELRESELRFRQLAENVGDVFWMSDPQAEQILYVSPAFEAVWGRPAPDLTGRREDFLATVHPDDRDRVRDALTRQAGGEPTAEEYRVVRPDGGVRWVWDRGFPIRDAAGRVHRVAGIAEDVTDRKRAEEAQQEADRRKTEFISTLAHELRNPLAPILTSLHILQIDNLPPARDAQARAVIERQVGQMTRLIHDLVDVSRLIRDRIELQKQRVELAGPVARAVETARPLIDQMQHQLAVWLPAEPIRLHADPDRLVQVFGNLLTNAARYTDPGGRIELTAEPANPSGAPEVVVRVRDTGIGIPPGDLERIFEAFVHEERVPGRQVGGLGVGLALVKKLVELHGGSVTARSAGLGTGAEFTVRLPALPGVPGPERQGGAQPGD